VAGDVLPERGGIDSAIIAYVDSLHRESDRLIEQFLKAHAEVHAEFVRTHEREHEQAERTHTEALRLAETRILDIRGHYDILLAERDRRLDERNRLSEQAIGKAQQAASEAISAALQAAKEAVEKEAAHIIEQTRSNYVTLGNLQSRLEKVPSRDETDVRFTALTDIVSAFQGRYDADMRDVQRRLTITESVKVGQAEARTAQVETRSVQTSMGSVFVAIAGIAVTILIAALVFLSSRPGP
jgi:hypothetical protein